MSKPFIVHNEAGDILRVGTCPNYAVANQAGSGEYVMEGQASDIKDKIVDGKVTRRPQAEIDARTPKPSPVLVPEDRPAMITQSQWEALVLRVEAIEAIQG